MFAEDRHPGGTSERGSHDPLGTWERAASRQSLMFAEDRQTLTVRQNGGLTIPLEQGCNGTRMFAEDRQTLTVRQNGGLTIPLEHGKELPAVSL